MSCTSIIIIRFFYSYCNFQLKSVNLLSVLFAKSSYLCRITLVQMWNVNWKWFRSLHQKKGIAWFNRKKTKSSKRFPISHKTETIKVGIRSMKPIKGKLNFDWDVSKVKTWRITKSKLSNTTCQETKMISTMMNSLHK